MKKLLDNSKNRMLSQWWFDEGLCDTGYRVIIANREIAKRCDEYFRVPSRMFHSSEHLFKQVLEPTYNPKFMDARFAYANDNPSITNLSGNVPDDYDSLADPARAAMSTTEWFACMWQSWSVVRRAYIPASAEAMKYWSEYRHSRTAMYFREGVRKPTAPDCAAYFEDFPSTCHIGELRQAHDVCLYRIHPDSPERQNEFEELREYFISEHSQCFAKAFSRLPFAAQQDLATNVYDLFDRLEPLFQYSVTSHVNRFPQELTGSALGVVKGWWDEFRDQYVHGRPASFPSCPARRSKAILHCWPMEWHGDAITPEQRRKWINDFVGDSPQKKFKGNSVQVINCEHIQSAIEKTQWEEKIPNAPHRRYEQTMLSNPYLPLSYSRGRQKGKVPPWCKLPDQWNFNFVRRDTIDTFACVTSRFDSR